jgi:hypothetical protein
MSELPFHRTPSGSRKTVNSEIHPRLRKVLPESRVVGRHSFVAEVGSDPCWRVHYHKRQALVNRLTIAISLVNIGDISMIKTYILSLAFIWLGLGGLGHAAEGPKVIAEGEWSKPVADARGYAVRGRLVLCEKPVKDDHREVAVYVELQDVCEFVGNGMRLLCEMSKTDFRPEYKGGLQCEMRDKDKKIVKPTGYPYGGGGVGVPKSEWVVLPNDATIRLRASPFGVYRAKAIAITPELNKQWVIEDDDPKEYFLSGAFTVAPTDDQIPKGDGHVWRGSIDLPAVRIRNKQP